MHSFRIIDLFFVPEFNRLVKKKVAPPARSLFRALDFCHSSFEAELVGIGARDLGTEQLSGEYPWFCH